MACKKCCKTCENYNGIEYFDGEGLFGGTDEWLEINCAAHGVSTEFYDESQADSFAEEHCCNDFIPIIGYDYEEDQEEYDEYEEFRDNDDFEDFEDSEFEDYEEYEYEHTRTLDVEDFEDPDDRDIIGYDNYYENLLYRDITPAALKKLLQDSSAEIAFYYENDFVEKIKLVKSRINFFTILLRDLFIASPSEVKNVEESVCVVIDVLKQFTYGNFLEEADWDPLSIFIECGYEKFISGDLYIKAWLALGNHYSPALYNSAYALWTFFEKNGELFKPGLQKMKDDTVRTFSLPIGSISICGLNKWDFDDKTLDFINRLVSQLKIRKMENEILIPLSACRRMSHSDRGYLRYYYVFPEELRNCAPAPERTDVTYLSGIPIKELCHECGKNYSSHIILTSMYPTFERLERFFNHNGFKTNLFEAVSFDEPLKLTSYDGPFIKWSDESLKTDEDNPDLKRTCQVVFNHEEGRKYLYCCDDDIQTGDKVLVPVGKDNLVSIATVVGFIQPKGSERFKIKKVISKCI